MRNRLYDIVCVASKGDTGSAIYDRFMLFFIVLSLVPLLFKTSCFAFTVIDKITASVFIIDYLLRWFTADYKYGKSNVLSFIRYPFGAFAIIDLISILPAFSSVNSGLKLLRLLRLNKALKALRLLRYSKSFSLILGVIKRERRSLYAVCVLAGGYILLSALIIFQVEPDIFGSFFDALYWAVVTLTTVGYGDIYPTSDIGRIVGMISSFAGIAIVALPTGIITAGYTAEIQNEKYADDKN